MAKKRGEVNVHPNFLEYTEFIATHPNYRGLYFDRDKDGHVNWVVTGKSPKGQLRKKWWDERCIERNIPIQKGCYAKVARVIHPTGIKICQCCGEGRSIFYEYPNKNTVAILNRILGTEIDKDSDAERVEYTIREIIEIWCDTLEKAQSLANAFHLPKPQSNEELIESIYTELVAKESGRFSPGVMCNPPDRFDGYHSYCLCCRTKFDTGRHAENMQTYSQDRRAYEEWSDGDYNLANRLMGEFRKQKPMVCPICGKIKKMSADHIGPISLGFCHSKNFAPMCNSCNSAKNNRFTKSDVEKLLEIEQSGEQVISWHSKYIWDIIKHEIENDDDAKFASSVMAKCHQNVLNILALIYKLAGSQYLERFLHPEYSLVDYRFENVNLSNLNEIRIISTPLDSKNKRNNQERYIRIAFESLEEYAQKDNRKNSFKVSEHSPELQAIVNNIMFGAYYDADKKLLELIATVADSIYSEEKKTRAYLDLSNYESLLAAEPEP